MSLTVARLIKHLQVLGLPTSPTDGCPTFTFSTLPAASGYLPQQPVYVSDIGVGGSWWFSNGTLWMPLYEIPLLQFLSAAGTAVPTAETQFGGTITLPPKSIPAGCALRVRATMGFASSTAGTGRAVRARLGASQGSPLTNAAISVYTDTSTTAVGRQIDKQSLRLSATSIVPEANNQVTVSAGTAAITPVAVPDLDSNINYLCVSAQAGSGDVTPLLYQMSVSLVKA